MDDLSPAGAGDDAVDRLYRAHGRQVLAWAIRLGGPQLDPQDIAQEVFVVALRQIARFRGDAQATTWLYGITRNVVRNARRVAWLRRLVGWEGQPEPVHPGVASDEAIDLLQRRRAVQRALDGLGAAQREALVLCDLEERSAPEVAAMIGAPVGTVYSRLHAARPAFRKRLLREGIAPLAEADNVVPLRRPQ